MSRQCFTHTCHWPRAGILSESLNHDRPKMSNDISPAIAALQSDLAALESQVYGVKSAINLLCKHAGKPEMYPNLTADDSKVSIGNIQADTFYGKTIGAAAREYLEMRRAANFGPASTREIYDALIEGGFKFNSKNENNAMISLGQTLRKNSKMFHKLPNGNYGLLAWYPNAKEDKSSDDDEDKKSAADGKSAADQKSSDASLNHDEEDASAP